jgi:uncharacterized protein YhaN
VAEKKRQARRSKVQIIDDTIAKIDAETEKLKIKIAKNDDAKALLLKEKEDLLAPKVGIKDITSKIKEQDLPLDEVMKAIDRVAKKQQKQVQTETQDNSQDNSQKEAQGDS